MGPHQTLARHGVGLLVDEAVVPGVALVLLAVGPHADRHDVELHPQPRAQRRAHLPEVPGQARADELGQVVVLVLAHGGDDVVGDEVAACAHPFVELEMLDGEVDEIDCVVDGEADYGGVVFGEDDRDAEVKGLGRGTARFLG